MLGWKANAIRIRLLGSLLSLCAPITKAAESEAENLKVIPIGSEGSLSWNTEVRLRYDAHENRFLKENQDDRQSLFRGILGADLRLIPNLRILSEVGAAHVDRNRDLAPPNFENEASLQQLFIEARGSTGSALVGVMIGRQEFSDGPRQLISVSDGPNLHRTWNGVRAYAHDSRCRLSGYDLRITRLERGSFDERMDKDERISGLNASFIISPEGEADILIDPFYIQSENPQFRSGKNLGLDERHTLGIRTWGRHDDLRFDWTLALQKGTFMSRRVQAWGVFATQSLTLSQEGWQPELLLRMDAASGGGTQEQETLRAFHQLYASSSYLGEGQFLSLSNLLMLTPGFTVSPAPHLKVSMEYGHARRQQEKDSVYAGGMRVYEGTENVQGVRIGNLLRVNTNWALTENIKLILNYENLSRGEVLRRARLPSGSYVQVGVTYRY